MAYFDNAATTYPKPDCVYDFMDSFYRSSGANAGRGNYKLAQSAGALIGDTRKKIQELLHCQAKQVVFEPTATIALNIIIQGIIEKGAVNIYISPFEHNAVTRTLHHFEEQGKIKVTQLTVSKDMVYDLEKIRYQFDTFKPDFVIVSHVLYEKLVEGDSTPEAFANRLYEFIDEFNDRFNSEISSDDILQLCVNKS